MPDPIPKRSFESVFPAEELAQALQADQALPPDDPAGRPPAQVVSVHDMRPRAAGGRHAFLIQGPQGFICLHCPVRICPAVLVKYRELYPGGTPFLADVASVPASTPHGGGPPLRVHHCLRIRPWLIPLVRPSVVTHNREFARQVALSGERRGMPADDTRGREVVIQGRRHLSTHATVYYGHLRGDETVKCQLLASQDRPWRDQIWAMRLGPWRNQEPPPGHEVLEKPATAFALPLGDAGIWPPGIVGYDSQNIEHPTLRMVVCDVVPARCVRGKGRNAR